MVIPRKVLDKGFVFIWLALSNLFLTTISILNLTDKEKKQNDNSSLFYKSTMGAIVRRMVLINRMKTTWALLSHPS
jgi:hypothetical protein